MNGSAYNAGMMYETAGNTLRDNGGVRGLAPGILPLSYRLVAHFP